MIEFNYEVAKELFREMNIGILVDADTTENDVNSYLKSRVELQDSLNDECYRSLFIGYCLGKGISVESINSTFPNNSAEGFIEYILGEEDDS